MISIASIFSAIIAFFKISSLKTGLIKKINRHINVKLSNVYYASEGLLKRIDEEKIPLEKAKIAYINTEKALNKFRIMYSNLENAHFLYSTETKEISGLILNNLYDIESKLRAKAFSDINRIPEDEKLIEIASYLSLS
jgi:hypothetical protein